MRSYITILLVITFSIFSYSQNFKSDSLFRVLQNSKTDTIKLITLNALSKHYLSAGKYDSCLYYTNQAVETSELITRSTDNELVKKTNKYGLAVAITNLGIIEWSKGNYDNALKHYHRALKIREEMKDKVGIALSYNNIANVYSMQGNYPEALIHHSRSLKVRDEILKEKPDDKLNKKGKAISHNNMGSIYWNQGNYPEALQSYFKALKVFEEIGDRPNSASAYDGIGIVYYSQKNFVEAIKYQEEALKIKIETGDKFGMAATYNNIGGIHEENEDLDKALLNYNRSLAIREEIGDQQGIAGSYSNIGGILIKEGNFPEALKILEKAYTIFYEIGDQQGIAAANNNLGNLYVKQTNTNQNSLNQAVDYFTKGLEMANIVGSKEDIKTSYWGLSEAYDKKGDLEPANALYWKRANEFYKKFIIYRDSLDNEENTRQTVQAQMNYEFEKKEAAQKIEQMKKDLAANEEKRKQNVITFSVIAGLIVVLVFAAFIWRSLSLTRKQKLVIEAQKELVEEKQKEILDSIHYARRIQQAILPKEAYITKQLDRLNKSK